jgi:hypothetical protein
MAELFTPQSWAGEKDPWLSGASTAVGVLSSLGAGMAPKIAAKTAGQTGRLAKLGQLYTKDVAWPSKWPWLERFIMYAGAPGAWKHKAMWTVPAFIHGITAPSGAAASDTTQAESDQIPAVVPWRSPAEAALVAATAGYSGQYRGYLDTIDNRTKAQQQALEAVLPSYAPALNELGEAADVYQQEHLRRAEMLRQLLAQMNQTVPYMQPTSF